MIWVPLYVWSPLAVWWLSIASAIQTCSMVVH